MFNNNRENSFSLDWAKSRATFTLKERNREEIFPLTRLEDH